MRVQRAAAALRPRHVHVEPVGGEDARGRGVDVAEDDALHAACDERDAGPWAREVHGRPGRAHPRRRDLAERPQRAGRGETAQQQRRAEPPAVRKHVEDQAPQQALAGSAAALRPRCARGSSRSGGRTARPTGRRATHAMQPRQRSKCSTTVSVSSIDPVDETAHQVDPSARRVHLLVPERVRRARRQAEAAVHAVGDQFGLHRASRTRSASGLQAGGSACST